MKKKEMKVTISINTFFRDKIQKDGFKTYIIATFILVALMWLNNVGENTSQEGLKVDLEINVYFNRN